MKLASLRTLTIFALFCFSPFSYGLNISRHLDIYALVDTRLVYSDTDNQSGWFKGGLGKTRYDDQFSVNIAEASLLIEPKVDDNLSLSLYAKYDKEQNFDLVEAAIFYQQNLPENWHIRFRGGVFFPQISLENSERFWLSAYNITPAAINSWIGEEVRTTGAEFKVSYQLDEQHFAWQGSVFVLNDPVGSLLAWRGWAIHSQKTGVFSQVPLADLPEFKTGGVFHPFQDAVADPFREVDQRVGFSTGLEWHYKQDIELSSLYYNNNTNPAKQDGSQYAWQTNFIHFGIKANIADYVEILSQYLSGNSKMGPSTVNIDFQSYYFMLRKQFKQQRFSLRYEHFKVTDLDSSANDDNNETGWGLTAAYSYQINSHHKLIFEAAHVESKRPMRTFFRGDAQQNANSLQLSYRLSW